MENCNSPSDQKSGNTYSLWVFGGFSIWFNLIVHVFDEDAVTGAEVERDTDFRVHVFSSSSEV